MEWISEIERIDKMLHAAHIPADVRLRITAQIANAFAQADKEQRTRRQLVEEAVRRCHGDVRKAAEQEGWSHETFYAALRNSKPPVTV